MKIVYTPIHGSGNKLVRRVLDEVGFKNVLVVKEQELPDGEFSTVSLPNPEDINALSMAIDLAKKEDADLVIGTDPDCDRVGVAVKKSDGEYVALTGNQVGCLLLNYIAERKEERHQLVYGMFIAKSIVTTKMANKIARSFCIHVYETLTGFKYIGKEIDDKCSNNVNRSLGYEDDTSKFLLGFEESYGYLVGGTARDKDGVVSSMMICQVAAYYKDKGMTLYDAMQELYKKFGYYLEETKSYTLEGADGREKIERTMKKLREDKDKDVFIDKLSVEIKKDYLNLRCYNMKRGKEEGMRRPAGDVLYYDVNRDRYEWFCIRPSGTEPKIKLYFGVCGGDEETARDRLYKLKKSVIEEVEKLLFEKE